MKRFIITYAPISKYEKVIPRNVIVTVSRPTNNIGQDSKSALNTFIHTCGNLKKNEVFSIQEINDEGKSVGEPILPTGDNSIVPVKK